MKSQVKAIPQDNSQELERLQGIQVRYLKLMRVIDQLRKPGESSEQTLNRLLMEKLHEPIS